MRELDNSSQGLGAATPNTALCGRRYLRRDFHATHARHRHSRATPPCRHRGSYSPAALLLIVPTNGYLHHHPITPLRSKASITPPRSRFSAVRLCEPPLVDESKDEPPPPITLQERLKLFLAPRGALL